MSEVLPPSPRWEGFTLAQKYDWFNARPGAGVTEPTATALGGLGSGVGDSADVLQRAMADTGVSWQGQAATATADSMDKAAQWARASGQVSGEGGGHVDGYGGSWTTTKNQIAAPVPEGSQTWWDHVTSVFGVQSDFDKNVAANHAADQRANEALTGHYSHSVAAVGSFPDPTPVPSLTGGGPGSLGNSGRPGASSPTGARPGAGPGRSGAAPTGGSSPHASAGTGTGAGARAGARTSPGGGAGGVAAGAGHSEKAGQIGGTGVGVGAREGGTTLPAGWTPLTPTSPSGATPAAPGEGTGLGGHGGATPVPLGAGGMGGSAGGVGKGIGRALNPGLTPLGGSLFPHASSGYAGGAPGVGRGVALAPRGGPGPGVGSGGEIPARAGMSVGETGSTTRAGGPGMGGMPPAGVGAGGRGRDRDHRNTTFIPSDEPFVVPLEDDVTSAVITPDEDGWVAL